MKTRSPLPDARSRAGLRRLQRCVAAAVTAPPGKGTRHADAVRLIKPNGRMTAAERLDIYRVQYWLRLLGSIRDDFPALEAALGERAFERLCRAYLEKHPSRSFTLRNLGARLPEFVARHPRLAGKAPRLALDLARFEWAQVVAFDGAALPPLPPSEADPATLRLRLQPHLTLLDLAHPADAFAVALQKARAKDDRLRSEASNARTAGSARAGKRPPLPKPGRTFLAVHRVDHLLYVKRLEPEAFRLLRALEQGKTLARAVALAFPAKAKTTPAALAKRGGKVGAWFALWAELGWLAAR